MKRLVRQVFFLFALVALVGTMFVLNHSNAVAQGPESGVHFFGTTEYYKRIKPQMPSDSTNNLSYYGGPIMVTSTTYAIYWAPSGHAIDAGYQSLINRYFSDVGGSNLYGVITQYHDNANSIQNSSNFGGSYTDTTAYPHAGTAGDPLTDSDIQNAVLRALTANGWTASSSHVFFVFTAQGVESCADSVDCTPGTAHPAYCAYHSHFAHNSSTVLYANMPYDETWTTQCRDFSTSPNGNLAADSEISTTSHEHFEAVTDPTPPSTGTTGLAWYDFVNNDNTYDGEVSDKCAYSYGTLAGDGSNVTLGSHKYVVQREWSNNAFTGASYSGCVLGAGAPSQTVFIDSAYTTLKKKGAPVTVFHRGNTIFYFGTFRNTAGSNCDTGVSWLAKGGKTTLATFSGTITVAPGTANFYLKRTIPSTAALRKYTLTVSGNCGGHATSAQVKFQVAAGASAPPSDSSGIESGPLPQ